jgi:uncharacterized protein YbaR (Trm112 family)
MIDEKLLEILVCPACKTKVVLEGDRLVCQNAACGLRYPVRDDIPVMLIAEAEKPDGGPAAPASDAPA